MPTLLARVDEVIERPVLLRCQMTRLALNVVCCETAISLESGAKQKCQARALKVADDHLRHGRVVGPAQSAERDIVEYPTIVSAMTASSTTYDNFSVCRQSACQRRRPTRRQPARFPWLMLR